MIWRQFPQVLQILSSWESNWFLRCYCDRSDSSRVPFVSSECFAKFLMNLFVFAPKVRYQSRSGTRVSSDTIVSDLLYCAFQSWAHLLGKGFWQQAIISLPSIEDEWKIALRSWQELISFNAINKLMKNLAVNAGKVEQNRNFKCRNMFPIGRSWSSTS